MLEKYLIDMIKANGALDGGAVTIEKVEGVLMINTEKGSLCITGLVNEAYRILYSPPLFEENENWKEVFDGSNEMLTAYEEESRVRNKSLLIPEVQSGKYVPIPIFLKDMSFAEALDVSLHVLSRILPKEHSLNMMTN